MSSSSGNKSGSLTTHVDGVVGESKINLSHEFFIKLMHKFCPDTVEDGKCLRMNTEHGEYILNSDTGDIALLMRWKFNWVNQNSVGDNWTYLDEVSFIYESFSAICYGWNDKIFLSVSGDSDFAEKFKSKRLPFSINMILVHQKEHWNVDVLRTVPGNDDGRPYVNWKNRFAHFYFKDTSLSEKCAPENQSICGFYQVNIVHEIGHMIRYLEDEYELDKFGKPVSKYKIDTAALMNVGMELRERYLEGVCIDLNLVYPLTTFSVASVIK